ncbi:conjugal transfer protein TraN, partial [Vibrio cyclitrophicus]
INAKTYRRVNNEKKTLYFVQLPEFGCLTVCPVCKFSCVFAFIVKRFRVFVRRFNGGWGTDVGLAQCNEEEKALGKAKDDKLTIYLGSYCAEKVLG